MEVFDTAIAIMAGLMIIPAVFAFSGGDPDTLQAGPCADVYYDSESVCKHGIWNSSRNFVLPAGAICSTHQLHCPDRKCSFYL